MTNILAQRIAKRMQEVGINGTALSRKIGKNPGFIRQLMVGDKTTMHADALNLVAKELGCDPAYLLGADGTSTPVPGTIEVALAGSIAAGSWRSPGADHFAGASVPSIFNAAAAAEMDMFHYQGPAHDRGISDGALVGAVKLSRPLTIGDLVVVERKRGDETERSLRRVVANGTPNLATIAGETAAEPIMLDANWRPIGAQVVGVVKLVLHVFGG